jgi:fibronectin type 3 domain-containing protein
MTAALTRIEPTRVWDRSTSFAAEDITEKVVPNEVADSADPMMNVSTAPGWCQIEKYSVRSSVTYHIHILSKGADMKVRSEIKRPSQLQEHWKGNFASKDQAVFEDHLSGN